MQLHPIPAPLCPGAEACIIRNAGKAAFKVQFILGAVGRIVQHGIHIVKDIRFCDGSIGIMRTELCQSPIGDVIMAVAAFVGMGYREALGITSEMKISIGK